MTATARQVLDDCKIALSLLEDEADLARWRVHWVAALALVRAVGHVLQKVDGRDADIRKASDDAFRRWKSGAVEHEIFREFIELERNNVLKQYDFAIHPLEDVPVVVELKLQSIEDGHLRSVYETFGIGSNIYRPVEGGYREGDDARDVFADAIEWWGTQLTAIDSAVRASRSVRS